MKESATSPEPAPQETSNRKFIPVELDLNNWEELSPFFMKLEMRQIDSVQALQQWLSDWNELDIALSEHGQRLFIASSSRTNDPGRRNEYLSFLGTVGQQVDVNDNQLVKKFLDCDFTTQLNAADFYPTIRALKKQKEIYRSENNELATKESQLKNQFNDLIGAEKIIIDGKAIPLDAARNLLKNRDRNLRREVFEKIAQVRVENSERLDALLSELIEVRQQIAHNADFANYRDYKFVELGRFDYSAADCKKFHQLVADALMPLVDRFAQERKQRLNLEQLAPYDLYVELSERPPLQPVKSADELLQKCTNLFSQLDKDFGECFVQMRRNNLFDIESRLNKAQVGFNAFLPETRLPFIFMNSNNSNDDICTLLHEGGHAIHAYLTANIPLRMLQMPTHEVNELASHSMELMGMENIGLFYNNPEDLITAKKLQLGRFIKIIPFICLIDAMQHELYENPQHSLAQRHSIWNNLYDRFNPKGVDYSGFESMKSFYYQKEFHIYHVPFYSIEYAFSILGAIAIWRNYKSDPKKTVAQYKAALSSGNRRTIPELYETAGVKFDFSEDYLKELMNFVSSELQDLEAG